MGRAPAILLAPNAFKGTYSAAEISRLLRKKLKTLFPSASFQTLPVSDGGDGLCEVCVAATGGRFHFMTVSGPLSQPVRARFGMLSARRAVLEMAQASGLHHLSPPLRPLEAHTFGTGQLIRRALDMRCRQILIGMGGSASSDGGSGMAQALGVRLLDAKDRPIGLGASALKKLARIDLTQKDPRLKKVRVTAVADVTNPLLGPRGSAAVYGPQKGASPKQVRALEKILSHYARILRRDCGADVRNQPGSGAAGGLGAGLIAYLNAEIVEGAGYVLRLLCAEKKMRQVDWVVTGEGKLDRQSFYGKAPVEVARMANRLGIPCIAVCGQMDLRGISLKQRGLFEALLTLRELEGPQRLPLKRSWRELSFSAKSRQ